MRSSKRIVLAFAGVLSLLEAPCRAEPTLPRIAAECGTANPGVELAPLPNSIAGFKERKMLKILAIGGPTVASGPQRGSNDDQELLQKSLEQTAKGLAVEIVNRGISGELAADAAERLKNEVALIQPDLVIWQVGTADALARISTADFKTTLRETIDWLKAKNVDVILVGAKFSRRLESDKRYQQIRQAVFDVARERNVMRISQWQTVEAMNKARGAGAVPLDEHELTEDSYFCVAQYIARGVAAQLFGK